MSRVPASSIRPLLIRSLLAAALISGCSPVTDPIGDPGRPDLAKAPAGPTVTSALPSYAHQGDAAVAVRILGSGFDQGSVASWEREGAADLKVSVLSTRFVSSTELVATIDVASDAAISLYDVAVTTSTRKKGIGMERFTVTVAQPIGTLGGNTLARAVNDQGATVGYSMLGSSQHAFFAAPGAAMADLGPGQAYDLDITGSTVVGWIGGEAVVWRASGSSWPSSRLPDNGAGSRATAIATTTSGLLIGGSVNVPAGRNKSQSKAALWREDEGSSWTLQVFALPEGFSTAGIEDVNWQGQAVGTAGGPYKQVYVWEADGTPVPLASPAGDLLPHAFGINPAGTIVVGQSSGGAVYWKRDAEGNWLPPRVLESCGRAIEVNDAGMIVGQGCQNATLWVLAEDGTVTRRLPGLGGSSDAPAVEGINNAESPLAAGKAKQQGSPIDEGVIWNLSSLTAQ
jgi:probable HAF family extracellular repeat protein